MMLLQLLTIRYDSLLLVCAYTSGNIKKYKYQEVGRIPYLTVEGKEVAMGREQWRGSWYAS